MPQKEIDLSRLPKQISNLLNESEELRRIWESMPSENRKIVIKAVIEGKADIDKLLLSLDDLEKKQVSVSAKFFAMAKSIESIASPIAGYAAEFNKYAVSLERMGSSSQFGVSGLKTMRSELSLLKSEMSGFFEVSNKLFNQGFSSQQIETTLKNLRAAFGNEAIKMAGELGKILETTPTLRKNPTGVVGSKDLTNILESGQGQTYLELQKGGLFGGVPTGNDAAEKVNKVKDVQAGIELLKDSAASGVPAELIIAGDILNEVSGIANCVQQIAQFLGAAKNLATVAGGTEAGAGGVAASGGIKGAMSLASKFGPAGLAIGATAAGSLLVGNQISKWATGRGAKEGAEDWEAMGGVSGLKDVFSIKSMMAERKMNQANRELDVYGNSEDPDAQKGYKERRSVQRGKDIKEHQEKYGSTSKRYDKYRKDANGKVILGGDDRPLSLDASLQKQAEEISKYSEIQTMARRKDVGFSQERGAGLAGMRVSSLEGNAGGIEAGYEKTQKTTKEFFDFQLKYFDTEKKVAEDKKKQYSAQKQALTDSGKDTKEVDKLLSVVDTQIRLIDSEIGNTLTKKIETYRENLTTYLDAVSKQGAEGYGKTLLLQQAAIGGELGVSQTATKGGQIEALVGSKKANVASARNTLTGAENAVGKARDALNKATTEKERNIAQEELNKRLGEQKTAVDNLNSSMKDTRAFEYVTMQISAMSEVTNTLSGYLETVNGSWAAMGPVMQEQMKLSEQSLANAKAKVKDLVGTQKLSEGDERVIDARKTAAVAEINLAKQRFDFAKKEMEIKMSEHSIASSIMKEQGDFLAEMGGHFSDVLSMKAQAFEEDRKEISEMKKGIEDMRAANGDGLVIAKAENDLKRKEMELARNTIGFQKSVYEKFVGFAFGALADKGVKSGRMDASVMMGVEDTRVKNRAGMFVGGESAPFNRDELSAYNATGRPKGEKVKSEGAKKATQNWEQSASKNAVAPPPQRVEISFSGWAEKLLKATPIGR